MVMLYLSKTIDDGVTGCDEFDLFLTRNSTTLTDSSGGAGQLILLSVQPASMNSFSFTNSYAQNCYVDNIKDIKNKNSPNNSAKLYPNPAENLLTVETEIEDATATIYDQLGRAIFKQKFNSLKTTIDVSGISPGVYYLELKSKNALTGNKFIKE